MTINGPRTDIHFGDDLYPQSLTDLYEPPKTLHAIGDPTLLERPSIAVLGPRRATSYGQTVTAQMIDAIANTGMPVVTSAGLGIARQAMDYSIILGVPCIAVLGNGLADPYPSDNKLLFQAIVDRGGCIVSEYSDDTPPQPHMFRRRNQILAAISHSILLVEAGMPSGTYSIVDDALRMHRDIYAVPGPITSPESSGPNTILAMELAKAIDSPQRLYAWLRHTIEKGS